ncbi:MAG TPA: SOS response-associated peptidase [Acidobacteriaceae bacterium]|nr:SOS response-associated peptidase [Acidobacteriaceae bacterium]
MSSLMCGRYELHTHPAAMALAFGIPIPPDIEPHYNIAPSQMQPVVRLAKDGTRELAAMRWSLVPHWATDKSIAYKTINARAETIATAPAFRDAFKRHRCLIPATGFYEWKKVGAGKQPYHIGMIDGAPFAFAGLWSSWKNPEGEWMDTYTVVTTTPNELAAKVHNRMPVILAAEDYARWLDVAQPNAGELLRPYPADEMKAYPVSTRVNTPKHDDARLIERIEVEDPEPCTPPGVDED